VKYPSGDGDAVYQFIIKIYADVLVFIKNCRGLVSSVVIFIMLLAGFVPHLQVTFFMLLEDLSIGLTRCERPRQNSRIIGVILIMRGEWVLADLTPLDRNKRHTRVYLGSPPEGKDLHPAYLILYC
jgi:hypothetical protein